MGEAATPDGDMPETTVRLCPQLDAPRRTVTVGSLFHERGTGTVEQRPHIVATHLAILYQHVLRRLCTAQGVRALQHDGIIVERIHPAVPDHHPFAAIDVQSIAVSVAGDSLYQQVVHPREQHGKVAAAQEVQTLDRHMAAVAQSQRLISDRRAVIAPSRTVPLQHLRAVDQSFAFERHVVQVLSPDERVVPMAVPEVLIA